MLTFAHAQYDPAADQDALIDRQKMLKAANQVEILDTQINSLKEENTGIKNNLTSIQKDLDDLKRQNTALREQLLAFKAENDKQKKDLVNEVSNIVAKNSKATAASTAVSTVKKTTATYEGEHAVHTVAKGDTLSLIAKAYTENGIKTSVSDIIKANGMTLATPLKVGQTLIIPKK
jgi:nucleoid-associated protein YgaU